jgi:hypothetical protein
MVTDKDELWMDDKKLSAIIVDANTQEYNITCASSSEEQEGMVTGHAYSIIDAYYI